MHSSTTRDKSPTIPALTSLRFIAAMMLVLYHYNVFIPYPPIIKEIMLRGIAGVCFFFILSGFVLTYNYFDAFQENLLQYRNFVQARFARIFPAHAIALILITPVTIYFLEHRPDIISRLATEGVNTWHIVISWFANLLLLNMYVPITAFQALWNEPAWSINDEAFFYLLLPLFLRYIVRKASSFRYLGWLIVILFLIQINVFIFTMRAFEAWDLINELDWFLGRSPFLRVWEFLIGCVIGVIFLKSQNTDRLPAILQIFTNQPRRNSIVLITCLMILAIIFLPLPDGHSGIILDGLKDYILFTPVFAVLILACAFGQTLFSDVLDHPMLVLGGEASYALYITHWIPVMIFKRVLPGGQALPIWWYFLAIVLTLLASVGFYFAVEMPLRQWLRPRSQPTISTTR